MIYEDPFSDLPGSAPDEDDVEYPDHIVAESASRIEAMDGVLRDLGYTADSAWAFPRAKDRKSTDRESFDRLAEMRDAAELLAIVQCYAETVGMKEDGAGWSMSALPRQQEVDLVEHATTVSVGARETFAVDVTADSGTVVWWVAAIDEVVPEPRGADAVSGTGGGTVIDGDGLPSLLMALEDARFVDALRKTYTVRMGQKRRMDRHNPWLGELVVDGRGVAANPSSDDREIERRYRERVVKQRLHQRDFKLLLLAQYPAVCSYCGLDVLNVLEAAHIIRDADGGAASAANGRLLCANHHRAFDAGLLTWTGSDFIRTEGEPEVLPAPRSNKSKS